MKLSPTMRQAEQFAIEHDGKIVRFPGGFWSHEGWKGEGTGKHFGTTTINGLVKRRVGTYTKWQERNDWRGAFPIEFVLSPVKH